MGKRTTMKAYDAHINPSDAANSLQKVIDGIESKGHYIVQYVAVSQYTGLFLAHDYPDKKKPDVDPDTTPAADPDKGPDAPAEAGAPAVTDDLTKRGTEDIPAANAPDLTPPASVTDSPSPTEPQPEATPTAPKPDPKKGQGKKK